MDGAFISYGRSDDESFVERLYRDLAAAGIALWRDRESMRSRGRSFLQEIQDGIADFDRLLLLVGPHAVASDYCRAEWEFALEHCRVVIPLFHFADARVLPPELARLHGVDFRAPRPYGEALAELLTQLREPVAPLGELRGVDTLPPHHIVRPGTLRALDAALLGDADRPQPLMAGRRIAVLHGMAGSGKSVAAAAWARRCFVRRAFPGGLHGLALGRSAAPNAGDLQRFVRDLGERPYLVLADDVWELAQIEPLVNALGPRGALLVTTREAGLAAALGAAAVAVGELDPGDALTLLARWAGADVARLPPQAEALAQECGALPLALAMAGAMVGSAVPPPEEAVGTRWERVLGKLRQCALGRIAHGLQNYPHPNLLRALQASIDALPEGDAVPRYRELAVFGEDSRFGTNMLRRLWNDADGFDTDERVRLYIARSLLLRDADGRLHLHDLHHDANVAALGAALPALHLKLLEAYRAGFFPVPAGASAAAGRSAADWLAIPDDGYIHSHLCEHLLAAGLDGELQALLDAEAPDGQAAWDLVRSATDASGTGFRGDVRRWWRHLHERNRAALQTGALAPQLGQEVRAALSIASLSSRSGRIEPQLLQALVASGQWSMTTAWAALWQMPDAHTIESMLEKLAPRLDASQIVVAFRWYLHGHPYTFSTSTMRALLERVVELLELPAAVSLVRGVRQDKYHETEARALHTWIDAGQPLIALRALQALDAGARQGEAALRLARTLPAEALPMLARAIDKLDDGDPGRWRSRTEQAIEMRASHPAPDDSDWVDSWRVFFPSRESAAPVADTDGAMAAYREAMRLPAEKRRERLIGLLPGAPAAWRAQIAGELLRGARRIGDAERLQFTVQPLLRALARTGRRADVLALAAPEPPNPALWLALGDADAALAAARAAPEVQFAGWLETIALYAAIPIERRLALVAEIDEPVQAVRALLALRADHPAHHAPIDAALAAHVPWDEPGLRVRVAACALTWALPDDAQELRSDSRSDAQFLEAVLEHLVQHGGAHEVAWLGTLVPEALMPAAREQLRPYLLLDPRMPALESLFAWAYRELNAAQADAEAQCLRGMDFSSDPARQAIAVAHGLGQLALHARGADRAALMAEIKALAQGLGEDVARDEVLLRVRPLLEPAERVALAERLVAWAAPVLLSETDTLFVGQYFDWVLQALDELPAPERHRQLSRLLQVLAERRRDELAGFVARLAPQLASLGGADALLQSVQALRDVVRRWP